MSLIKLVMLESLSYQYFAGTGKLRASKLLSQVCGSAKIMSTLRKISP